MNLWLVIIGAGIITYAIRLSMIVASDRLVLPDNLQRALSYVPVAVLSAIIFPEVLQPGGQLDLSLGNARLIAGLAATLVAYFTKNVMWTVVAGMGVLWSIQLLIG